MVWAIFNEKCNLIESFQFLAVRWRANIINGVALIPKGFEDRSITIMVKIWVLRIPECTCYICRKNGRTLVAKCHTLEGFRSNSRFFSLCDAYSRKSSDYNYSIVPLWSLMRPLIIQIECGGANHMSEYNLKESSPFSKTSKNTEKTTKVVKIRNIEK